MFNPSGCSNATAYYGTEEADVHPHACLYASLFAAAQAERRS